MTQPNLAAHNRVSRPDSPPGWQWVRLGEVCDLNPRRPDLKRDENAPTTFIQMSAVAEAGRGILSEEQKPFSEVRKGYTYFGEGDVLFAKITPCMQNGKHAIARNLIDGIGFGSTEFHVLRPKSDVVSEWIHHFILQPWVLQEATAYFSGAVGQRRVPEDYLAELELPLPPVAEQQRIAAILNEQMAAVERARAAAEVQLEAAKALPTVYLRVIFSGSEAQQWPKKQLRDLLLTPLRTGISKPTFPNGDKRCLTLSAVRKGMLDFAASKPIELGDEEAEGNWVRPGVFYVVRGNGNRSLVGRGSLAPATIPSPVLYPDLLIQVDFDSHVIQGEFLTLVWNSLNIREDIESRARTSAGIYKINQANLAEVKVPVPSLSDQESVCARLAEQMAVAEQTRQMLETQLATINALPPALLRRAFSGAL